MHPEEKGAWAVQPTSLTSHEQHISHLKQAAQHYERAAEHHRQAADVHVEIARQHEAAYLNLLHKERQQV